MPNISVSLATGATGLGVVALSTTPSIISLASNLVHSKRRQKATNGTYRDKDGVSTEEETAQFSSTIPKIFVAILTIAGALVATTSAVLSTLPNVHGSGSGFVTNWLNASAWVSLSWC